MIGLSVSEAALCNKLYTSIVAYWLRKDFFLVNAGKIKPVDAICSRLEKSFATIGDSDNFHLIIAAERIICIADLDYFQRSRQGYPYETTILSGLQKNVDLMEEINGNLTFRDKDIQKYHRYSSLTRIMKSEFDREGLPKDAVRLLLSRHKIRLRNESEGMHRLSYDERNLFWQRQQNLQKAEHLYIMMQRDALGVDDNPSGQKRKCEPAGRHNRRYPAGRCP